MVATECVNLRERFGRKHRIEFEESYYAEHGAGAWTDDPWLQVIPCARGHICPCGGSKLAACTRGLGPTVTRLRALPFVEIVQDGADGVNAVFDVEHFAIVAEIMQPRRKRRLSESHKARLLEAGAKSRFQPGEHGSKPSGEARICVPEPRVV